jgi:arylsulfatase A-like enzyme
MNKLIYFAFAASLIFSVVSARHDQRVLDSLMSSARPNIVFIMTDDQDLHMDSMSYMPFVQKHLVDQGTFYKRHFCTVALCCPSRVNLWTGKAAHNTNVTDLTPPYGTTLALHSPRESAADS